MEFKVQIALMAVLILLYMVENFSPENRQNFDIKWFLRSIALNLSQLSMVLIAAITFNQWLSIRPVLILPSGWPEVIVGYLAAFISSFIVYWWHRVQHSNSFLWRVTHQLHHSPSRFEVLSTNYAHPLDFLAGTFIDSVVCFFLLGLSAEGAAWCVFAQSSVNYFIHSNIKTPRWVGYFIQRPEMHRVHHQRNHHTQNYGLPLWDLIFGTWVNPTIPVVQTGFSQKYEHQIIPMLLGKDVHKNLLR